DAHDPRGVAADQLRLPGHEPGPYANVEHRHAGTQPRVPQGPPPIPRAGAECHYALHTIVIAGGAVEEPEHPGVSVRLARVVVPQRRMRDEPGVRSLRHGSAQPSADRLELPRRARIMPAAQP